MSAQESFKDLMWRIKFLFGLTVIGALVGGYLFLSYSVDWMLLDLIQFFQVARIFWEDSPDLFLFSIFSGAFCFFWTGLMFFWRPWERDNKPSSSTSSSDVKRPW